MAVLAPKAFGKCRILDRDSRPLGVEFSDPLFKVLQSSGRCPRNVFELRKLLQTKGAKLSTSFINNQGFHNPASGSFSLFEMVTGDLPGLEVRLGQGEFFFGHFTGASADGSQLVADQEPSDGKLMIELIVYDRQKEAFHFYEMIGNGKKGQWFYRGDSFDILDDIQNLHRARAPGEPIFGAKLRCSGCHINGGPIMKELSAFMAPSGQLAVPHNDWWRSMRPLPLGDRQPDDELSQMLETLVDAGALSDGVLAGVKKLQGASTYQKNLQSRSLQEILRPLFAPQEMNFASDIAPNDFNLPKVTIPSEFFLDPRFGVDVSLQIPRREYMSILEKTDTRFPKTNRRDADHAWLTPVKATSDILAIDALVEQGVLTEAFVMAVLAVDFTNPVFSKARAALLQLLPEKFETGWQDAFQRNLSLSELPAAAELLENLRHSERGVGYFRAKARKFVNACHDRVRKQGAKDLYLLLLQRRLEVKDSEISKNLRGEILEPDFRVIFPVSSQAPAAGMYRFTKRGRVVRQRELTQNAPCADNLSSENPKN